MPKYLYTFLHIVYVNNIAWFLNNSRDMQASHAICCYLLVEVIIFKRQAIPPLGHMTRHQGGDTYLVP